MPEYSSKNPKKKNKKKIKKNQIFKKTNFIKTHFFYTKSPKNTLFPKNKKNPKTSKIPKIPKIIISKNSKHQESVGYRQVKTLYFPNEKSTGKVAGKIVYSPRVYKQYVIPYLIKRLYSLVKYRRKYRALIVIWRAACFLPGYSILYPGKNPTVI